MTTQWDTYADLYDQGIGPTGDQLHQELIDPIIFDFLSSCKKGNILEAGCGNGYLINTLSTIAKHVTGIDSSQELLKAAKKLAQKKNTTFEFADITKTLPFADNTFDTVTTNMVIQYLPDLNTFAQESSRILQKNGKLIVIIDHPAHALFLRAQELIGKKNEKFLTSGSYFQVGLRKKKSLWDKAILEYYHRPLMDYLNAFTPYFQLEKMVEKSEGDEMPRILGLLWTNI